MDLNAVRIRRRAQEIRDQEIGFTVPLDKQIKATWRINRPKMWARLVKQGLVDDLALVLQTAMWDAMDRYLKAGMPPTDAREQAEMEWLMLEPEEEEDPANNPWAELTEAINQGHALLREAAQR